MGGKSQIGLTGFPLQTSPGLAPLLCLATKLCSSWFTFPLLRLLLHTFCPLVFLQTLQILFHPLINGLASCSTKELKLPYSNSSIFLPSYLQVYIVSLSLHSQLRKSVLPRQITPSFVLVLNITFSKSPQILASSRYLLNVNWIIFISIKKCSIISHLF